MDTLITSDSAKISFQNARLYKTITVFTIPIGLKHSLL